VESGHQQVSLSEACRQIAAKIKKRLHGTGYSLAAVQQMKIVLFKTAGFKFNKRFDQPALALRRVCGAWSTQHGSHGKMEHGTASSGQHTFGRTPAQCIE
jgi:predicted nucleic acid-binding Zn ribbon protein